MIVYHYTSFARAETILGKGGLDPAFGQPCCHEHEPARFTRGLRALTEPDPPSWRHSPVFGDYMAMLMRIIEDRLCLEAEVLDSEAVVVDRALIEGYMYGGGALELRGRLPSGYRFLLRASADAAMWDTRVPPSDRATWSGYLLPKVIITSRIPPERVRVSTHQPYLLDPRWDNPDTRRRADEFGVDPFPSVWAGLLESACGH